MTTKGVVIDYGLGNVASVAKAFEKIGATALISRDAGTIARADFLVLPGVGAFGDGMANLERLDLIPLLEERVLRARVPFLGICLGMQLLTERGFEFGERRGLGWIKGTTEKLSAPDLRLPHVGWDDVRSVPGNDGLFSGIADKNFYFVHSFHVRPSDPAIVSSVCTYGETFVASIRQDNICAAQFHPEKSQQSGLKFLENFLTSAANA